MDRWRFVSALDGAAILLQGVTALTRDLASWKDLVDAYRADKTPTKIVIFEVDTSPLLTAPKRSTLTRTP